MLITPGGGRFPPRAGRPPPRTRHMPHRSLPRNRSCPGIRKQAPFPADPFRTASGPWRRYWYRPQPPGCDGGFASGTLPEGVRRERGPPARARHRAGAQRIGTPAADRQTTARSAIRVQPNPVRTRTDIGRKSGRTREVRAIVGPSVTDRPRHANRARTRRTGKVGTTLPAGAAGPRAGRTCRHTSPRPVVVRSRGRGTGFSAPLLGTRVATVAGATLLAATGAAGAAVAAGAGRGDVRQLSTVHHELILLPAGRTPACDDLG